VSVLVVIPHIVSSMYIDDLCIGYSCTAVVSDSRGEKRGKNVSFAWVTNLNMC